MGKGLLSNRAISNLRTNSSTRYYFSHFANENTEAKQFFDSILVHVRVKTARLDSLAHVPVLFFKSLCVCVCVTWYYFKHTLISVMCIPYAYAARVLPSELSLQPIMLFLSRVPLLRWWNTVWDALVIH